MASQFATCASATFGFEAWTATAGTVTIDSGTVRGTNPRSYKLNTSNPAVTASVRRNGTIQDAGTRITFWVRFPSVSPAANGNILQVNSSVGGILSLSLRTDGKLQAIGLGASAVVGATVLSINTWYRIGFSYTVTSATVFEIRVYLNGVLEITISSNGTLTNTGSDRFLLLSPSGFGTDFIVFYDEVVTDNATDLTDYFSGDTSTNCGVAAKLPNAAGAANAFDTGIGAGANRWDRVKERAISEVNGWQHAASTSVSEQYTIQNAATGDQDISAQGILAVCSWLWGKEGASGGGTGEAIWRDGTAVGIALGTSSGYFFSILDQTTFPTGNQAVGMRSTGGARDAFLYECGMMVVYAPPTGQPTMRRWGGIPGMTPGPLQSGRSW